MYGFIPAAALAFVKQLPNSEDLLDKISRRLDGNINTNFYTQYDDKETLLVLNTVAAVTNLSLEDLLANMGTVQLEQFEEKGYGPLIRSLGSTMFEFLEHLDSLHLNLVHSYPNMKAPSFRPERLPDGRVLLHYYSSRPGLWPYATALLSRIGHEIYGQTVHFEHVQKKEQGHDHDIFEVVSATGVERPQTKHETASKELLTCDATTTEFDELFPWHLQVDSDLRVISMGSSLALRFNEEELKKQKRLMDVVTVTRPNHVLNDFEHLKQFDRTAVMLMVRDEWYSQIKEQKLDEKKKAQLMRAGSSLFNVDAHANTPAGSAMSAAFLNDQFISATADFLYLQGEFRYNPRDNTLLFVGVPSAQTPEELYKCGLGLPDIPIHSNGREMLFNNVHQSATVGVAAQLEQVTQDLEKAKRELGLEKKKVHELLSSILPQTVIQYLANGEEAPAERFGNVSILFSDIVGFTKISSAVRPTQVMDMLNSLFLRFDQLCDKHGVYKVETIGDAYMVASGLPETTPDHAERLCRFAIDMLRASREVLSPVDGAPIRMRIGMHSGSVMAGVVGQTRPRYCLFGDAVAVAAQMESAGVPSCIQISASMMSELRAGNATVQSRPRGEVELKGRGLMQTFILVGMEKVDPLLLPPDDEVGVGKKIVASGGKEALLSMSNGADTHSVSSSAPRRDSIALPLALQMLQPQHPQSPPEPVMYMVRVQARHGETTTLLGVQESMTLGDVAATAMQELGLPATRLSVFADEARGKMLLLCQPLGTAVRSGVVATLTEKTGGGDGPDGDESMEFVELFLR
ncbi:guanylyl cyclase a-subunit [Salpingoeca rosetta]|uniref:guanylate cyclase n=1 Tax=Salpingoeca rosetta (strain ATCC 50818 / BSB-021) TaxID=946362 RepID=F2U0N3_SALR5|nr:guanylyl cyclase a-subunit [Salpingoeca rosetta]EGD80961.1 guanylyl cyclase a-subunit [Salpingoeca rosetta]|eukprot:XP_004997522.1 guanylyl cyclase a-subunit [Salpingoeca rosetta]